MKLLVTGETRATPEQAFHRIAPIDLGYIFWPFVTGSSGATGPWDRVGTQRTVHVRGGIRIREELTAWDPPHHFGYVLRAPLVRQMRGDWWFDGPKISWRYEIEPGAWWSYPLFLLIELVWRPTMKIAMKRAIAYAESAAGPSQSRAET